MNWNNKRVLVTGGASFIGSHLVDALVERGAAVHVVDDLSSGRLRNIAHHINQGSIQFTHADLRQPGIARDAVTSKDVVFHLAADHGGRGYVELHQAGPASNLFLDGLIFWESVRAGVGKVVYASSGCVYPNFIQNDPDKIFYLREKIVVPPYDADNMYGWAKLMAELTLKAYHQEHKLNCASCRYFTVYGPRGVENHAVMAMIARAFIRQNPFEVWGDGNQIRNWTYVDDIVSGTIAAAEKVNNGLAVNLGTMERIRVKDAARMVLDYAGQKDTPLSFLPEMPTGPVNRVADNSLAELVLDWKPKTTFAEGLKKTMDWYFTEKNREEVEGTLQNMLTTR